MHLLYINEGITEAFPTSTIGVTFGRKVTDWYKNALSWNEAQQLAARGSGVSTTDIANVVTAENIPNRAGLLMWVTAHELTHQLIQKDDGEFDASEHTIDDDASIMNAFPTKKNTDPTTMKFVHDVQKEFRIPDQEW